MKRLLLGFVLLIMLTGCQQSNSTNVESLYIDEITTYKEVIDDGKVEIGGISYDIRSVSQVIYKYDKNENVIERVTINGNSKMRLEYLYKNNQLIEDRSYSNDELSLTSYYYYKNDLLTERKTVTKGGLEARVEYSYGNKTKTQTYYGSDGNISFIATEYVDDNGKRLKGIITEADGEVMSSSTFYYENDLLIKAIEEKNGVNVKTFSYEYNNVGNKIMEYNIFYGEINTLAAVFYAYIYNENLLPETMTVYRVQSPIAEEDIRNLQ